MRTCSPVLLWVDLPVRSLNSLLFASVGARIAAHRRALRAWESAAVLAGRAHGRFQHGVRVDGPVLRVHLIAFRRPGRELDDDTLRGGLKLLRDAIADWFGLDDSQRVIAWEYSQAETRGRAGVGVLITKVSHE